MHGLIVRARATTNAGALRPLTLGPWRAGLLRLGSPTDFTGLRANKETTMLHESTFEYLKPTDDQVATMAKARAATKTFATELEAILPDGPDKTVIMRQIRDVGFWANVTITRLPDGTPRT